MASRETQILMVKTRAKKVARRKKRRLRSKIRHTGSSHHKRTSGGNTQKTAKLFGSLGNIGEAIDWNVYLIMLRHYPEYQRSKFEFQLSTKGDGENLRYRQSVSFWGLGKGFAYNPTHGTIEDPYSTDPYFDEPLFVPSIDFPEGTGDGTVNECSIDGEYFNRFGEKLEKLKEDVGSSNEEMNSEHEHRHTEPERDGFSHNGIID